MRLLKIAKTMIAAAAAVFTLSVNSYAGAWMHDSNGWWYVNDNRSYTTNNWQKINGSWYYFNSQGYMETGWKQIGGSWYYLHADGKMAHDTWIDGTYYLGSNGRMLTNATTPDGYRVGADGRWIPENKIITQGDFIAFFYGLWNIDTAATVEHDPNHSADYYSTFGTWGFRNTGGFLEIKPNGSFCCNPVGIGDDVEGHWTKLGENQISYRQVHEGGYADTGVVYRDGDRLVSTYDNGIFTGKYYWKRAD